MNRFNFVFCILASVLAAIGAEPASPSATAAQETPVAVPGPHIAFDKAAYDFGKVESGELVKHTFFFTNTGNQTLEVREVRPSCGCTTAGAWDKQVEPGKFGSIPVQFNSAGYSGGVHKSVTVVCNDSINSNLFLQITGTAWKPIDLTPAFISFSFGPDFQISDSRVVRIVNNLDQPITVSEPNSSNPLFKPELKTVKEGKEYELRVTVLPPLNAPSVSAPITLKTSNAKTPVLSVTAFATVQPVVTAVPAQLTLPAGPLTNGTPFNITLQNNSTNSLILSEPTSNIDGVQTSLKEVQPGKRFELTAVFPTDFQAQPGHPIELKVRSNSPKLPEVRIPVYQLVAPAKPAPPTAASSSNVSPAVAQQSKTTASAAAEAAHLAVGTNKVHGPKIEFAESTFDFGRVESGKIVNHVFEFSNTGDQLLEIRDVWTSCGCTAATNWTRQVEPGKSGRIPILFNSGGKEGPLTKTVSVVCNDPIEPKTVLQFTAQVWKPIDALPPIATFTFGPDFQTNQSQIIRLVNNLEEPVTIFDPVCTNNSFRAELKMVKEGKEFELRVSVVPPLPPGSSIAPITLNTSSAKMPVVTVTGYAMVKPALQVMPPRLRLVSDEPLADPAEFTVRIENQSTNTLTLSEPMINAKGAAVRLHEVQPGRLFELFVTFPAGFQAQPGEEIEARIKSNFSQVPLIKIPVLRPMVSSAGDVPGTLNTASRLLQ